MSKEELRAYTSPDDVRMLMYRSKKYRHYTSAEFKAEKAILDNTKPGDIIIWRTKPEVISAVDFWTGIVWYSGRFRCSVI